MKLPLNYEVSITNVRNPATTAATDSFEIFTYEKFDSNVYKIDSTENDKTIYKIDKPMTFKSI